MGTVINIEEKIDYKISIKEIYDEYQLTEGQNQLVDKLDYFFIDKHQQVFLLKGYAGTGKTFIIKGLTEYFKSISRNYVLTAPTGKAAKVIKQKTKSNNATTIHGKIYSNKDMSEYKVSNTDGTETYKFYFELKNNDDSVDTVYIVDEASMIPDSYQEAEFIRYGSGFLLHDFLKYVNLDHNDHNKKLIFIGDNAQLPPIDMNYSPALNEEYLLEKYNLNSTCFELTEIVRQEKESGVIQNSINLRNAIANQTFNKLNINDNFSDIENIKHNELMHKYLNSCSNKINGESIIIAYSNSSVYDYNKIVRQYFFQNQENICQGDKVMAIQNNNRYEIPIFNGEFGLVKKILSATETRNIQLKKKNDTTGLIEEINIKLQFIDVEIGFKKEDDKQYFFPCKIIENLLYSDKPNCSSDEQKALYIDFCIRHPHLSIKKEKKVFLEYLKKDPYFNALRMKFGYAITCHKAQGSEWNHVFVDCDTNQKFLSSNYFRWLYTAITRTVKTLYLLNSPNIKIGGNMKPVFNNNFFLEQEINSIDRNNMEKLQVNLKIDNLFGIHSQDYFRIAILNKVKQCIGGHNVEIVDIHHNNYQESYTFSFDGELVRSDIFYNGKNQISKISTISSDIFKNEIEILLKSLEGKFIIENNPYESQKEKYFNFEEFFLKEFYERIKIFCQSKNIIIDDIKHNQYHERYTFTKDNEIATFKFDYNSRKQFTKFSHLQSMCTSSELINEIYQIIKQMS